jgi:MFS transporter, DHA1 family, multidrug resistance protein
MASSLTGFYTTAAGATFGWLIARQFDGTVRPLAIGFLVLSLLTAAAIVWTEGRDGLFKGE